MNLSNETTHKQEWLALHQSYEQYEVYSLKIKLLAVVLLLVALIAQLSSWAIIFVLAVLWLQESIWKTFQARTESRILKLETAIASGDESFSYNFYSDWAHNRNGLVALIKEYLSQAKRPTVAFPYVVLMAFSYLFY